MTGDTVTSGDDIDLQESPFEPAIPLGPASPVCYKLVREIKKLAQKSHYRRIISVMQIHRLFE